MNEPLFKISFMTGEFKLEPVKYYVVAKPINCNWLFLNFKRTKWVVESEFCTISGFKTEKEAVSAVHRMGGVLVLRNS